MRFSKNLIIWAVCYSLNACLGGGIGTALSADLPGAVLPSQVQSNPQPKNLPNRIPNSPFKTIQNVAPHSATGTAPTHTPVTVPFTAPAPTLSPVIVPKNPLPKPPANPPPSPDSLVVKAEPETGTLSQPRLGAGQKNDVVPGLAFIQPSKVAIQWESRPGLRPRQVAKIYGKFPRNSGRTLTTPDYPANLVWLGPGGGDNFLFTAPILSERTLLKFRSVDATGVTHNQIVVLSYRRKNKPTRNAQWAGLLPTLSLGVMYFNYREYYKINALTFNPAEMLLTVKASYDYRYSDWDFGASALYTPMVLSNSEAPYNYTVLSMDLKAGYIFPKIRLPWRLSLSLGLNFTTMFVPTNYFGYSNSLASPVIFTVQRILPSNDNLFAYFRFMPIPSATFSFDLSDREYAVGVGFLRTLPNQHPLTLNFDVSDFLVTVPAYYNNVSDTHYLHSTSFGFSAGYGF